LDIESLAGPAIGVILIFSLRLVGVAVGTVRNILTLRGMEWTSAGLGFAEVLIYTVGVAIVVNDLMNIANLVGYCAGFSAGNIVGIRIERRLAVGTATLQAVSLDHGRDVVDELRSSGYGATLGWAEGMRGPVAVITSVVPRRQVNAVRALITSIDSDAFVVVGATQPVNSGWLPVAR
jgi:uncharacterized protein YebE (UPF0316 family)